MTYTNSPLVAYTKLSSNHSGQRNHAVDRISPHCVVGMCSAESLGEWFARSSTQASSNYGIDKDGRVGMYVEEKNRSWCTSSNANDQRAITIECASGTREPYEMNDAIYNMLIRLCVDICKRYGKKKLLWFADKAKTLAYEPKADEMVITVHRWFADKSCPGEWLYSRLGDLAAKVTAQLGGSSGGSGSGSGGSGSGSSSGGSSGGGAAVRWYRVRKSWTDSKSQKGAYKILVNAKKCADQNPGYKVFDADGKVVYDPAGAASGSGNGASVPFLVKVDIPDLNIRTGAGTNFSRTGKFTGKGVFTIVEVRSGEGSASGWGKLKSGAGWIALDMTTKI